MNTKTSARLLVRLGAAMLVLALVARLSNLSRANLVGDDLAIMATGSVVLLGVLLARFGPD